MITPLDAIFSTPQHFNTHQRHGSHSMRHRGRRRVAAESPGATLCKTRDTLTYVYLVCLAHNNVSKNTLNSALFYVVQHGIQLFPDGLIFFTPGRGCRHRAAAQAA